MKFSGYVAIFGGFLAGAILAVMTFGLCNPAAWQVANDFKAPHEITFAVATFYGVLTYPLITLVSGVVLGIISALITKTVFQKHSTLLARFIGGTGYCLFFFMTILGLQVYRGLILPLSTGD